MGYSDLNFDNKPLFRVVKKRGKDTRVMQDDKFVEQDSVLDLVLLGHQ